MTHVVRAVTGADWRRVKELRLAALRDPVASIAFLETYESAVAQPDGFWERRAAGSGGPLVARQFVAERADGGWDGSVTVLVERAGGQDALGLPVEVDQAHLVGVFVRPERRGTGLAEALFEAAVGFARESGLSRVRLYVHQDNARAEAFYRKAGFVRSGRSAPVPGDGASVENELVLGRMISSKGWLGGGEPFRFGGSACGSAAMSDVVVRRAESDDTPALAAMRRRFKVEDGGDEVPQDEEEFTAECEQWLRSRMAGSWRAWVAEVDGRPCGHVFVCLVEKVPSPYPGSDALGYVTNFYVVPEQRNRGLGRALLDEATRYARARGLDTLIVWPSERSAPLYRRCGFDSPGELLEQPVAPS